MSGEIAFTFFKVVFKMAEVSDKGKVKWVPSETVVRARNAIEAGEITLASLHRRIPADMVKIHAISATKFKSVLLSASDAALPEHE